MNPGCRFVTARRRADPATPFHPIFALPLCWHYSRLGWKICFILVVSFWWKKNTHANKSQIRIIPLHWKLASKAQLVQHHQTSWCLLFFFFSPFLSPHPHTSLNSSSLLGLGLHNKPTEVICLAGKQSFLSFKFAGWIGSSRGGEGEMGMQGQGKTMQLMRVALP